MLEVSGAVTSALTCEGGILFAGILSGDSLAVVGGTLAADDVKDCKATIDGGSVRVSFSHMNTPAEVDHLSDILRKIK